MSKFIKFPREYLDASARAIRVWSRLRAYAGRNGVLWGAIPHLAEIAGVHSQTIRRYVHQFNQDGWLSIRVVKGRTSQYHFKEVPNRYVQVAFATVYDKDLNDSAFKTYVKLLATGHSSIYAASHKVAEKAGVSKSTYLRNRKTLERHRLLSVIRRGFFKTSIVNTVRWDNVMMFAYGLEPSRFKSTRDLFQYFMGTTNCGGPSAQKGTTPLRNSVMISNIKYNQYQDTNRFYAKAQ